MFERVTKCANLRDEKRTRKETCGARRETESPVGRKRKRDGESVSRVRITPYGERRATGRREREGEIQRNAGGREKGRVRREWERAGETEGERERERVYSAHSSARSIGECRGRRTWTTHTVPRDHRASPLAYIRLHGSPKTIPWLRTRSVPIGPQSPLLAAAAVRYFDTVDTRLISIRYGRRGTNCRMRPRRTVTSVSPAPRFSPLASFLCLPGSSSPPRLISAFPGLETTRRSADAGFFSRSDLHGGISIGYQISVILNNKVGVTG